MQQRFFQFVQRRELLLVDRFEALGFRFETVKRISNAILIFDRWPQKTKIFDLLPANVWNTNARLNTEDMSRKCGRPNQVHQETVFES